MTTHLLASTADGRPHLSRRLGLLTGLLALGLGAQAQLTVTSTSPVRNANQAPRSTNVNLIYNQALNATTANQVRVFSQQAGGRKAAAYSASGSTLTVNPNVDFKPGETVFVTAPTTVRSSTGAAATPRVFQFTTQAGVGPGTFGGGTDLTVLGTPVSVTPADVDGDGDLDLLTANQSSNTVSVRLNNGQGSFSNGPDVPVGSAPVSVVAADVDGDGDLDILTANSTAGFVSVRLNNGQGSFSNGSNVPVGSTGTGRSFSVAAADVNGDGNLDILAANGSESTVSVRLGNGQGSFSGTTEVSVGSGPISLAAADVNNDGNLDVVTANLTGNTVSIRLGNGQGSFNGTTEVSVGSGPGKLVVADVNNDGNLDLLTANDISTGTVSVRLNSGTSSFSGSDISLGSYTLISSLAVADVDGDGDLDLLTGSVDIGIGSGPAGPTGPTGTVSVRRNNGGTFSIGPSQTVSVGVAPYLAVADVDGDNDLDVLTANSNSNAVSVRLNLIAPLFPITFTPTSGGTGTVVYINGAGFIDEDGRTPTVTSVAFNGTPTTSFAVLSPTQVGVLVPNGATTGPITVTTTKGTVTSAASFVVVGPLITTTAGATIIFPQTTTPVDPGLTVTDADSPTLVSAVVGITNGFVSGEDLLSFTPTGSITGSYNASNGLLNLSAPSPGATLAQWQAVLRSVSYRNSSATPNTASRTVSFRVNDGTVDSNVASKILVAPAPVITRFAPTGGAVGTSVIITGTNFSGVTAVRFNTTAATTFTLNSPTQITAIVPAGATTGPISVITPGGTSTSTTNFTVLFAPVVTTTAGTTTALEQTFTAVDPGLTVTDADGSTLASATVSISSGFVSSQDALLSGPTDNITTSYNPTTGVLTLTSSAPRVSLAQWQTVLRNVSYRNSSAAPTTAPRTVSFVVNDGTFNSSPATKLVQVQAVNGAPAVPVDANPAPNTVAEQAANGTLVGLTASSTDADGTVTYSLTNSAGGRFTINASTGVVTVANGTLLDYETATAHTITVQASDGTLTSTASFTIQVTNVNEAPVVTAQRFTLPAGTVVGTVVASDPDAGQTLTYSITAGNPGGAFTFAGNQLQVANAAVLSSAATYALTVQVQDNGSPSLASTATVTVTVTPVTQVLYRLNAGGPALTTSLGQFAADQYFSPSRTGATSNPIAGTTDDVLYQTERFEGAFGYALPVSNGTYQVVLHFAELYWTQPGQRVFDVRAEGQLALDNYDILKKVAPFTATTETLQVLVTDGVLNLDLSALASNGGRDAAKLSALEVLARSSGPNQNPIIAAQNFSVAEGSVTGTLVGTVVASDPDAGQRLSYSITAGNTDGAFAFVGNQLQVANAAAVRTATSPFSLTVRVTDDGQPALSATATVTVTVTPSMQVLYRLNAGGGALSTSLGQFAADQSFSPSRTGVNNGPIAGTTDDALYQTERFEGAFGYSLRVPNGTYQVVLHFAELYWTQPGQRVFDVRAEGQLALDNYDILQKVAPFTATTETFSVVVTDGVLNLDFSALASDGGRDAAKLSALEVLSSAARPGTASATSAVLAATATGKLAKRLEAMPNPFTDQVGITFQLPQAEAYTLTVYDMAGRELTRQAGAQVPAGEQQQVTLSLGAYPTGVYVVRLTTASGSQQTRLVKQ
ncbi:malectin domain-containing carbohydrate-binding protein [Hymenobacter crusticola]|uniref:Cadherin domain-containing protein n=1 Tax=Hymenobacter crusticola TaxID=1770526 RepID=A0A243WL12_9BACT|nr:malectin domain-containing carbohydrate-binding protein [Hymenobacter crusticola]OUJ76290.1 hypothetical protein BXP70_03275 [Hymenobacter crusticola]